MNQSQGDPATPFIVEGHGFPPGQPVVVKLSEVGPPPGNNPLFSTTSTFRPVTATGGTFNASISQLYSGSLQPGLVTVQVTAPGGSNVQTNFMVLPPGRAARRRAAGAVTRIYPQASVHHRSSWRDRHTGSASLPRSAEVMMPCSIRTRTATSSDSRTSLAGQPAVADLAPQHLDVLGHPGREQVAELGVGLEPLQLVVGAGHLQRAAGDLRRPGQRRGGARVEQPRPAPDQRDQEELGHRVQVEGQDRALAVRLAVVGGPVRGPLAGDRYLEREPVVEHGARADPRGPRVQQPAAGGSPPSSSRGSRIRYPSPSTYSAWVRLMLVIHAPAGIAVTMPARRDSPRPGRHG